MDVLFILRFRKAFHLCLKYILKCLHLETAFIGLVSLSITFKPDHFFFPLPSTWITSQLPYRRDRIQNLPKGSLVFKACVIISPSTSSSSFFIVFSSFVSSCHSSFPFSHHLSSMSSSFYLFLSVSFLFLSFTLFFSLCILLFLLLSHTPSPWSLDQDAHVFPLHLCLAIMATRLPHMQASLPSPAGPVKLLMFLRWLCFAPWVLAMAFKLSNFCFSPCPPILLTILSLW